MEFLLKSPRDVDLSPHQRKTESLFGSDGTLDTVEVLWRSCRKLLSDEVFGVSSEVSRRSHPSGCGGVSYRGVGTGVTGFCRGLAECLTFRIRVQWRPFRVDWVF